MQAVAASKHYYQPFGGSKQALQQASSNIEPAVAAVLGCQQECGGSKKAVAASCGRKPVLAACNQCHHLSIGIKHALTA